MEQERMAEEEARGEETAGEEKEESPRMITGKGLAEAFADLGKLLKKSANTDCSTERFSVTERGMLSVRCLLTGKSRRSRETNKGDHHGHVSEKREASGRPFRGCFRRSHCHPPR